MENNEIVLFDNKDIKLEVNIKDETVWLNLDQMAKLFKRDKSVISRHINNALSEELNGEVVVAKIATTSKHGAIKGKVQTHIVDFYNLDVIISVGYRVKSKEGIKFRQWANKVLKDYMLKGYSINLQRLEYLKKTVSLIDIANRIDEKIEDSDARQILKVIGEYTKALDLLDDYDHKSLKRKKETLDKRRIEYCKCLEIIKKLKYKEGSSLFALEREKGLESIINNIYQTFEGKDIYKSVEEKGANFIYLIIKNHVFIDGNKRIAATLFIYFLSYYDLLYKNDKQIIDNNSLAALTLLIAESNPKEKNIMIDLIINFLSE